MRLSSPATAVSSISIVLIVLPPSETKIRGGTFGPVNLDDLAFPGFRHIRETLIASLGQLAADLPVARKALKVSAAKDDEILANTHINTSETEPALRRYTGVLFDGLDAPSLSSAQRSRADHRIMIASALWGALRATDRIPFYRLSAGSRLPGLGTLTALWKPALQPALAAIDEPIIDLRSTAYSALSPLPSAITVRVVTEQPNGTRTVVSHFNKRAKGQFARIIATCPRDPADIDDVIRLAVSAGLHVEQTGERGLQIVVDSASRTASI